ncbi:sigma-54 dependent transcriptional regulator [Limibacter armeniacum]|uniref:sigma-54-dependent transcriptional regulator n=1 Tax=Limibacter armeniacum TaxID=466084 RepID=UPI002FE5B067
MKSNNSSLSNHSSVKIFAAEDNPVFSKMLEYLLTLDPTHDVRLFSTGRELIDALDEKPSIITLDYTLPDVTGELVLKRIKQMHPRMPVIIISGQSDVKAAVDLFKIGVFDYISKDDEDLRERLLNSINNAKQNIELAQEVETLREKLQDKYEFSKTIIGISQPMQKIFSMLQKTVNNNITVSITGETGTGKEVVAKAIHFNSSRKNGPFIAVNIAAIPEPLLESELFGHEKGAFTGAMSRRIGKFEEANKGTIFLDEIGEMDINLQAKLLRVIQEREVSRIGSNAPIKLDVRIITATHRDLVQEVKNGNFREDLYYRLLGLPIYLPPLRERGSDILLISQHLIKQFAEENRMENLTLSKDAQTKLMHYHFPGNIRELKAVIELAAVMSGGGEITAEDIQFNSINQDDQLLQKEMTMREYTFAIVKMLMDKYNNNVIQVADILQVGKSTIYRYLKEMESIPND